MGKKTTVKRNPNVICLEGIHGVGKTTVFQILEKKIINPQTKLYPERLMSKPLWPFGSKDKQIAFRSEIHFIQQMIERNKIIYNDSQKNRVETCILDRSAISVLVYSKALDLEDKDFQVLQDLFNSVNWAENIMIYMEAKPEIILDRIRKRGSLETERLEWNEDDLKYIRLLEHQYNVYLYKISRDTNIKIIRFNTNNLTITECADRIHQIIEENLRRENTDPNQKKLSNYLM
jgi:deoxyadenosine/deoxycytidine kinase